MSWNFLSVKMIIFFNMSFLIASINMKVEDGSICKAGLSYEDQLIPCDKQLIKHIYEHSLDLWRTY